MARAELYVTFTTEELETMREEALVQFRDQIDDPAQRARFEPMMRQRDQERADAWGCAVGSWEWWARLLEERG